MVTFPSTMHCYCAKLLKEMNQLRPLAVMSHLPLACFKQQNGANKIGKHPSGLQMHHMRVRSENVVVQL